MNFKSTILAAALLIASAAASAAPITLTPSTTVANSYSATFTGNSTTNTFELDLTKFGSNDSFFGQVSANFTGGAGYDVTGVTLDGTSFLPFVNSTIGNNGADYWYLNLSSLTATIHSIVVTGTPLVNSPGFTGSLSLNVTPVPEAETYAMFLAGLGLAGFMARRRKA